MHDINICFIGGTRCELKDCTEESTKNIVDWLDSDEKITFKIDIPAKNKTICLVKENILFIEVV